MARQIERAGKPFGWLGVLDAWPEENTRHKSLFLVYFYWAGLRHRFARLWKALRQLPKKSVAPNNHQKPQTEVLEERLQGNPAPGNSTSGSEIKRMLRLYFPGKSFKPPVIEGDITVFGVAYRAFYRIRDRNMGWGARTRGDVNFEPMPGNHFTILSEPNVGVLARKIMERIGNSSHCQRGQCLPAAREAERSSDSTSGRS
jgi:thioesterase domain-containing protein